MKTIKEDFKLFVEECEKWIDFFGLKDWYVIFDHEDIEDQYEGSTARYVYDRKARVVRITLNKILNVMEDKRKVLKVAAFHEVSELLLIRLIDFAHGDVPIEEIDEEIHVIVRRLENSVYRAISHKQK